MNEPLKPRIHFEQNIQPPEEHKLRAAQSFDGAQAENFLAVPDTDPLLAQEGQAEAVVSRALKPRRSLWSKMVRLGVVVFAASLVGQGVQWVHQAWNQQDWIALGACTGRY
jgi:putative membrane protein